MGDTKAEVLDLSVQPELCEDMVSRQRLSSDLKKLVAAWKKYPVMAKQIKGVEAAIEYVEAIPSAQPERKKGKWINRSLNILYPEWERYTCSACGKHSYNYDFCPNCGSYNGGESDDKG